MRTSEGTERLRDKPEGACSRTKRLERQAGQARAATLLEKGPVATGDAGPAHQGEDWEVPAGDRKAASELSGGESGRSDGGLAEPGKGRTEGHAKGPVRRAGNSARDIVSLS